jgi:hypothetical protein
MPNLSTAPVAPGEHLAPAELRSWLEAEGAPHVLDVRSPAEFEAVHIPGSFNVPLDTLREHRERLARLVAGGIVLGAGLGSIAVPGLRWIATGVGAGLVTAALTDTCVMGAALSKLPYNRGAATCDIDAVVTELAGSATSAR